MLMNKATWEYVRRHADDDVRKLALQGSRDPEVDVPQALQQIAGWQTARRKLPSWAQVEGVVYPPHLNMEQCSSEQTARYKAKLVGCGDTFVDLTGGFGVDFYWMSQGFRERVYVEQNAELCAIVEANMRALRYPCSVCRGTASVYLTEMPHANVIYLDPARRNEHGGRTYGIADCTPNVLELLPLLMTKADKVILKLSPMLDWRKAVDDIEQVPSVPQAYVSAVHIVSVDNECKELLLVLSKATAPLRLVCVNGPSCFEIIPSLGINDSHRGNETFPAWEYSSCQDLAGSPLYLYEPNASVMKAGCFDEVGQRFPVRQVAPNSHLFLSSDEIGDFPGRGFQILSISSLNKREINQKLTTMKSANLAVRNFPMSVDQLRKKLKLKDGGDTYIFATTLSSGAHRLFICRKIG